MEKIDDKLALLQFLTPSGERLRFLVVESWQYLSKLRAMYPQAELHCVVQDNDTVERPELQGLAVQWCHVDYLSEALPLERKYFDYIISEHCLENAANPQDIAAGLGLYLKETGFFLFSFLNIRYWRVLKQLMEGHFYYLCSRVFTKTEMTNLMSASFYKDAQFLPVMGGEAPEGFIDKLETAGFENYGHDLEVKTWLVQAARSMPEIRELKRLYTPKVRAELAKLLRRVEYNIDVKDNREKLWDLCEREGIFPAYLANFIRETVIYINELLWGLEPWRKSDATADYWNELLEELLESYQLHRDREYIEAWTDGEPAELRDEVLPAVSVPAGTKIAFITCVNNHEVYAESRLYLSKLLLPEGMSAEFIPVEGATSMCAGYNTGARQTDAQYKVYLHQDALIVNKHFVFDLLKLFEDKTVGLAGVIGARKLPASGIWWDGMRSYGKVLHACEAECIVETNCMEPPEPYMEVEAVDGLMVATQYDLPWREDLFTGWHFYEIAMCKEMQRKGYKTIVPHQKRFWCIHCPKEKPLDPAYKIYQKKFLREYGAELDPEF